MISMWLIVLKMIWIHCHAERFGDSSNVLSVGSCTFLILNNYFLIFPSIKLKVFVFYSLTFQLDFKCILRNMKVERAIRTDRLDSWFETAVLQENPERKIQTYRLAPVIIKLEHSWGLNVAMWEVLLFTTLTLNRLVWFMNDFCSLTYGTPKVFNW